MLDRDLREELEFKASTPYKFKPGADGDAVAFIDPALFKDSQWHMQRIIHAWCVDGPRAFV